PGRYSRDREYKTDSCRGNVVAGRVFGWLRDSVPDDEPCPESVPFLLQQVQETLPCRGNGQRGPCYCGGSDDGDGQSHADCDLVFVLEQIRTLDSLKCELFVGCCRLCNALVR